MVGRVWSVDNPLSSSWLYHDWWLHNIIIASWKQLKTLGPGQDERSRIATESRRIYCSINIFRSPLWNAQGKNDGSLLEKLEWLRFPRARGARVPRGARLACGEARSRWIDWSCCCFQAPIRSLPQTLNHKTNQQTHTLPHNHQAATTLTFL